LAQAVRAAVMAETGGRVREISVASAKWLRVIRDVAPDLAGLGDRDLTAVTTS
jgi:hypothetical protein